MASNNPPGNNQIAGAITYSAGNSGAVEPLPVQPRQPRNLQGLLRFAMEATKAEDAPGNSHFGPMDEERRKFLAEAMAGITVDLNEVLRNSIEVLTNTARMRSIQFKEPLPPEVKKAFSVLLDVVDDIDIANDFYKMGGFAIFPICYGSENAEIRMYANTVLAELCQNNPFCQAKALECGFLSVLLTLAQTERGDALAKCLYALSCCSREYEPACREVAAHGGCEVLANLLQAPEATARTKVAFFIRYLCQHYNEAKEQFIKYNIIATIAEQLKKGHDQTTEHLLGLLSTLLDGLDPTVLRQIQDPRIGLRTVLENHLKHPDLADETYREEKEFCQELLCRAFHNCPPQECVEDSADR